MSDSLIDSVNRFRGDYEASREPGYTRLNTRINPYFLELIKGHVVEVLSGEPDALTYRGNYYYNSKLNALFQKQVIGDNPKDGKQFARWKQISNEMTNTDSISKSTNKAHRRFIIGT